MDLPAWIVVLRHLARDTFRQSLASRAFWLILGLSGLCILLCLSVRVEGATAHRPPGEIELFGADRRPFTGLNKGQGTVTLGFGAVRWAMPRDAESAVLFLEALLAKWAAGAVGVLLVLLWTSGFLPEFLHPDASAVLLARPVPRWALLVGKYLGVLAFVSFQLVLFVGGTWLALGVRTGVWAPGYLLCVPLLALEFAVLYSFSALVAVYTRNTLLCAAGVLLFWCLCATVNYGRLLRVAESPADSSPGRRALEAAYWALPKPTDLVVLLGEALGTEKHFRARTESAAARRADAIDPELSVLTSLLSAGALLGLAARRFVRAEY